MQENKTVDKTGQIYNYCNESGMPLEHKQLKTLALKRTKKAFSLKHVLRGGQFVIIIIVGFQNTGINFYPFNCSAIIEQITQKSDDLPAQDKARETVG